MSAKPPLWDVVIAGAGIAGATLALSLRQDAGDTLRVALCDPALANPHHTSARGSFRAVAVADDTRRQFAALGLWDRISEQAQPIRRMVITDGQPGLLPNPVFLTFDEAEPDQPLASMVFVEAVRRTLLERCRALGVVFVPRGVVGFAEEPHSLALVMTDGERMRTRLLAAADGGRSRLRHAARIQTVGTDYAQAAIVATLNHTEDHAGQATQHFFPAGPVALLPMRSDDGTGHRTSLVWTETRPEATRLASLPEAAFLHALQERIGDERGALTLEDRPSAHPLRVSLARRLVGARVALLGDAARTIHPLAGQGLNLGLRDAAALSARIVSQASLGLDPGAPAVLSGYEADRRADATLMAALTDTLDRLFSNDAKPVRMVRDIGLTLIDRMPRVKHQVSRGAGSTGPSTSRVL